MEIENKLAEILTILLGQEISSDSNVSMQNCEIWDSMKHIEIITTVEEEFEISLPIEEIPKLTSFDLLAAAIKKCMERS